MSALTWLDPGRFDEQPWANGLGRTTEIARGPDPDDWHWRLSIAQIDQATPFSPLTGTQRDFVTLDAPVQLRFADRTLHLLRLKVCSFEGAQPPACDLPDGPTRAFNLMRRHGQQGQLIARPLNGSMLLPARTGLRRYLHLLSGQARLRMDGQTHELAAGQHVWVSPQQATLDGGGEVILVELQDPGT